MFKRDTYNDKAIKESTSKASFEQRYFIMKFIGPLITIMLALSHNILRFYGHEVPNTTGIFAIIIIFSILAEGIAAQIVTIVIALAYSGYNVYAHDFKIYNDVYEFLINPSNTLIFFGVAIMAGIKRKQANKYLKELELREHKYKTLFNNANGLVFLVEVRQDETWGNIIEVNDIACEKLSYSKDELLKMTPLDLIPKEQNTVSINNIKNFIEKGRLSYERELVTKTGVILTVEFNSTFFSQNNQNLVLSIARDVTERRMMERKLKESEEFNRQLIELLPDGIYIHENEKFVYANPALLKILKATDTNQITGKSIMEFLHPDYHDLVSKRIERVFNGSGVLPNIEEKFIAVDGTVVTVETAGILLPDPNKRMMYGIIRDVTLKKQAEIKLSQSKERYEKLVELNPNAIFVHRKGKYVFTNAAGEKLLAASCSDDILNKEIMDFIHKDYHETIKKHLNNVKAANGENSTCEIKHIRLDGSIVDVEVSSVPILDEEGRSILTIVRDISERKKAIALQTDIDEKDRILAETLELDKIRTEFFANISHELRTPLNLIHATMQVFKKSLASKLNDQDTYYERYFNIVKQNTYRLLRLINNLIDITKMDAGFIDYNTGSYNIVSLVEDIIQSVAGFVEGKGLSIQFDTNVEEKILKCDADKIERIMLNLISNAVKFTDEGGSIFVNICEEPDKIIISVKDNGVGISKENQALVFDRFLQVDKSFKRNHEGSGIGLSIVKSMVEMHGGKISLVSEPNKGSTFIIELPLTEYENTEENYADGSAVQQKRKIDIIDIEFSDIYR